MNIVLWVVQAMLALLSVSGGAYKTFNTGELMTQAPNGTVPRGAWVAIGIFEMVCAILLIVPAAMKRMPVLTPAAGAALTVENLCLALALYAPFSTAFTAKNPLVWVLFAAIMAAFVAYGRFALRAPV